MEVTFNDSRANFMVNIAKNIYGVDPKEHTRKKQTIYARTALCFQLIEQKESLNKISDFLGKDRAMIYHYEKSHKDLMGYDKEYKELYRLFSIELKRPINYEKMVYSEVLPRVVSVNRTLIDSGLNEEEIMNFWKECHRIALENKQTCN